MKLPPEKTTTYQTLLGCIGDYDRAIKQIEEKKKDAEASILALSPFQRGDRVQYRGRPDDPFWNFAEYWYVWSVSIDPNHLFSYVLTKKKKDGQMPRKVMDGRHDIKLPNMVAAPEKELVVA